GNWSESILSKSSCRRCFLKRPNTPIQFSDVPRRMNCTPYLKRPSLRTDEIVSTCPRNLASGCFWWLTRGNAGLINRGLSDELENLDAAGAGNRVGSGGGEDRSRCHRQAQCAADEHREAGANCCHQVSGFARSGASC